MWRGTLILLPLLLLAGCSTAPVADFLDLLSPGRIQIGKDNPYGGVCIPQGGPVGGPVAPVVTVPPGPVIAVPPAPVPAVGAPPPPPPPTLSPPVFPKG
jgi:hypothetical protein